MKRTIVSSLLWVCLILSAYKGYAQQDAPNNSNEANQTGDASVAGKWASTPVNLYTGLPSISIPIYHYTHQNGLHLDISLSYFAGGVKADEGPTSVGQNWFLNAGGIITRTVRGAPDDLYPHGSLYNGTLPTDPTTNAYKYYHDSLDAEMDVFQFDFDGRSGEFCIGKNKQIFQIPISKMSISYDTTNGGIGRFTIKTEDGIRYVFNDVETSYVNSGVTYRNGYDNITYNSAWHLSQVIAPFSTDTIKFSYVQVNEVTLSGMPQTAYVVNATHSLSQFYDPEVSQAYSIKKISSIAFPDKRNVTFVYDSAVKYDLWDHVLNRIKIGDTLFRYGYLMDWTCCKGDTVSNARAFLAGIRYITDTAAKREYQFTYYDTLFPAIGSHGDTLGNDRDYWGYYNGANNSTSVPTLTGVFTGANRAPSSTAALSGTLNSITDPSGGTTYYKYESNDLPNYTLTPYDVTTDALVKTSNAITLSQVLGTQHTLTLFNDILYPGSPFSGTCNLIARVTSMDSSVTYATDTTTLYSLNSGLVSSFTFSVPNGNYLIKTNVASCTFTLSSMNLDIIWQNQSVVSGALTTGGLRIKQQSHFDPITGKTDTLATYIYQNPDGSSSGFLGAAPVFSYPYSQTVINGGTTVTPLTAISSEPINDLNYTQGSPVGYGQVQVIRGSPTHNLGKQVYQFTNLTDAGWSTNSPSFPYAPVTQPDWAMGLPKKVSTYDSTGRLIDVVTNTFSDTLVTNTTSNFQSRKLGKTSTTYNGDPANPSTPYTEAYESSDYYPKSGQALLVKRIDSTYHSDNSLQIVETDYSYDSNYNVTMVQSPYNQTLGLYLQKRFYYPYNYTLTGPIGRLRDSGILASPVSEEDWITGDANPRILSARINDFTQLTEGNVKPLTLYSLQSNAPVLQSVIGTFNAASLVRSSTYLIAQEGYSYDAKGNLLSRKNLQSGQSNSRIMDYFNQFSIATVSNAATSDIAYTSFESDGSGNWTIGGTARASSSALTGKQSYNLSSGNITKSGLQTGTTYFISVWGNSATISVNGSALSTVVAQQNGWNLYQTTVTVTTTVTISGSGLIDELRLHPTTANMQTTTYEPFIGQTSLADLNNTVQYYMYDSLNRLKVIKDKDLNVIKKFDYEDSTIKISVRPNWQNTDSTRCESPGNGNVDRLIIDINPFSPTYNFQKWVFDHMDCPTCLPCPGKVIDCVCDNGVRCNISSVFTKINGNWVWVCTWHITYSDCSVGSNNVEYDSVSCTVNTSCCSGGGE